MGEESDDHHCCHHGQDEEEEEEDTFPKQLTKNSKSMENLALRKN